MTKHQLKTHVKYLRALYAQLEALGLEDPYVHRLYVQASLHAKAAVALMIEAWDETNTED